MKSTTSRPPRKSVIGRPRPVPYVFAGIIGGFAAGVGFIALTSWFATSNGMARLDPFELIATIIQGPGAVQTGTADIWLGMLIHSVLSAIFGLIFALVTLAFRSASLVTFAGLIYGGIIYVVDFQVLARFVDQFSVFRDVNQPFEASVHGLYGVALAILLLWGARRDAGLRSAERSHRTEASEEERAA